MLLIAQIGFSQNEIRVEEGMMKMSQGTEPSFSVAINAKMDLDDLEDMWEDYQDDFDADDVDEKKGEFFGDNVMVESVSKNTIDIHSQIAGSSGRYTLVTWFNLGGAYLSSKTHPEAAPAARNWIRGFVNKVAAVEVKEDLKVQEKLMDDMEDDVDDLEDDIKDLEKDLKEYEKKMAEAKQEISTKRAALNEKRAAFEQQKSKVKTVETKLKKMQ